MVRITLAGLSGLFIFSQLACSTHLPFGFSNEKRQNAGSCASIGSSNYTDSNNYDYNVLCGTDYGGGDLATGNSVNFVGCFDQCDQITGCIGFAYLPGTCYFKRVLTTQSSNSYVNFAYKGEASEPQKCSIKTVTSMSTQTVTPSAVRTYTVTQTVTPSATTKTLTTTQTTAQTTTQTTSLTTTQTTYRTTTQTTTQKFTQTNTSTVTTTATATSTATETQSCSPAPTSQTTTTTNPNDQPSPTTTTTFRSNAAV